MNRSVILCYNDIDNLHISRKGNLVNSDGVKVDVSICEFCENLYLHRQSRKHIYCSDRCRVAEFTERVKESILSEGYQYLGIEIGRRSRVHTVCPNGHEYKPLIDNWNNGFRCQKCKDKYTNDNNPSWKGGYHKKGVPVYDLYFDQLYPYGVNCRRSSIDNKIMEVRCMYCDRWFIPTKNAVRNKIQCINGELGGEHNLYCSDECKSECPTFGKILYPKGFKSSTSREVQPELRKLVFYRDGYQCQKCGDSDNLHCHHITGIEINPVESADIDNCITLCKKCHIDIHKQPECDMKRKICGDN